MKYDIRRNLADVINMPMFPLIGFKSCRTYCEGLKILASFIVTHNMDVSDNHI